MLDLDLSGIFTDHARRRGVATVDVLVVCTGNICRSPVAALLLSRSLNNPDPRSLSERRETKSPRFTVSSAGTYGHVGHKMERNAVKLAASLGIPRSEARHHRGRWLSDFHLVGTDLVLTMTRRQLERVTAMASGRIDGIFTVREFEQLAALVPDEDFRAAADAAGPEPHARVRAALRLLAEHRPELAPDAPTDVIDPHRHPWPVFEQSAAEMLPGLQAVTRTLHLATAS